MPLKMGCAGSREISDEETCLMEDELALGYSRYSAEKLDEVFRKFSTHQRLNENQFRDAVEMLKVPYGDASSLGNLATFYENFRELGCYKLHRLLILVVLLGYGSNRQKVQLWFEIYDGKGTHSLTLVEAKKMVHKTFTIAVDYLLKLSTHRIDRALLLNYFEQLNSVKMKVCDEIVKRLYKDKVVLSRDSFIYNFEQEVDFKNLLTASGFRRFVYNQYKARPPATFRADISVKSLEASENYGSKAE